MNYLVEYQRKLGLTPDGIIGPNTAKAIMNDLGITDKLLFAHVVAQMAHESGGFLHARENLNYSADGLLKIFKKYFTPEQARAYARNPEKIANRVYANRMGNGDEASGDGWKYRGIFGLQLTGKTNIQAFIDESLGLPKDTDPESLLDDPRNYFLSAFFWFKSNGVDKMCVEANNACVTAVSRRVNGGTIGLDDRIIQANKMFKALGLT